MGIFDIDDIVLKMRDLQCDCDHLFRSPWPMALDDSGADSDVQKEFSRFDFHVKTHVPKPVVMYFVKDMNANAQSFLKMMTMEKESGMDKVDYVVVSNGGSHLDAYRSALDSIRDKVYTSYFFVSSDVNGPNVPEYMPPEIHWTAAFLRKMGSSKMITPRPEFQPSMFVLSSADLFSQVEQLGAHEHACMSTSTNPYDLVFV